MHAHRKPQSVAELMHRCGSPQCVMPIGLPASGKTTLSGELEVLGYRRFDANSIRGELYGDEAEQGDGRLVFEMLLERLGPALRAGDRVVIDNMNISRRSRRPFIHMCRDLGIRPALILLDVGLCDCQQRNEGRERVVPKEVIEKAYRTLRNHGKPGAGEGDFTIVQPTDVPGMYKQVDTSQVLAGIKMHEAVVNPAIRADLIGDVHGCYQELLMLLKKLGYRISLADTSGLPVVTSFEAPAGRVPFFVGDLVDRGPSSDLVLNLIEQLVALNHALAVQGNHDNKLMRALMGNDVKMGVEIRRTLAAIEKHGPDFRARVLAFLEKTPFAYETEDLAVVHAALVEDASHKTFKALALYGEVDGRTQADGRPVRHEDWEADYLGGKTIVHGHTPVLKPSLHLVARGGRVANIDTGACFGGKLTALRFPEMELVSVPARRVYASNPDITPAYWRAWFWARRKLSVWLGTGKLREGRS